MSIRILSYPKLRKSPVVSAILGPEGLKTFRECLDRFDIARSGCMAFLLHDARSFVLLMASPMPHDPEQISVDFYIPDDFIQHEDTASPAQQDGSGEALWQRAVSFLVYELFYIGKNIKAHFYVPSDRPPFYHEILTRSGFRHDGTMRDHCFRRDHYADAGILSMTGIEFMRCSTGLVPLLGEHLIVRASYDRVFEIGVIKRDEPMPPIAEELIRKTPPHTDSGLGDDSGDGIHDPQAYPYVIRVLRELREYLEGKRKVFELEPEYHDATEFQKTVWAATIKVPFGQTQSYEAISQQIGIHRQGKNPTILSRAVGTALSRNPVMIVIPCHRIIGKDGKLRGFAGGLDIKDFLLTHELAHF